MRILFVSAEVYPYLKTGGLGEVMGALPKAVHRLGHDVRVFAPFHGGINRWKYPFIPVGKPTFVGVGSKRFPVDFQVSILSEEVPIYFMNSRELFGSRKSPYGGKDGNLRYLVFDSSVFALLKTLNWIPDVIHCHDWHAGLIPNFIKKLPVRSPYRNISTVFTIHNAAFSGTVVPWKIPIKKQDGARGPVPTRLPEIRYINFLKRGIRYADVVTTVSQQYAKELLSPNTDHGLSPLLLPRKATFFGVRNGVDYTVFNPRYDPNLPVNYDVELLHRKYDNKRALQHRLGLPVDDKIPLLGMNTRISEQKGFDLVFEVLDELLKLGVQFVVVGTGQGKYISVLEKKMKEYPNQVAYRPYSEEWGSLVYAGADLFLMPSLFEPSGLGQMISLRYGTIPVVRKTGGLADTIINYSERTKTGNGFVFAHYSPHAFLKAIRSALTVFHDRSRWFDLMKKGMHLSYSWEVPAKKYVRMYRLATDQRAPRKVRAR